MDNKKSTNIQDGLRCCLQKGQWSSDGEYLHLSSNVTRTAWRFKISDLEEIKNNNTDNKPIK